MARRYPQDICDKMYMNTRVTDSDPNIVARFYRPYNGKSHDYTDPYIREYVQTISGDDYDDYGVVPKTIDMSLLAISRYFRNPHPYDEHFTQLYESAALFLDLEFKDCIGSKKISFDEALSDLDGTKSPGWPWTLMYNTKNDLWGSPHVSFFDEYWQSLATDDPVKVFCSASVKEELRQKFKIKMKNCRTVVCMDAFHLAASCMMYSDYSSRFKKAKLTNCSALGQSFLQGGAQKIVDYIDVFGPATCFSADAKQYDSRFTGFVFRLITQHFKRSIFELTKDDLKRLENLTSDLYNAPIVGLDGHVYYRETGSVSGHLMTTINNIQKNFLDWFVMWLELAPTHLNTYSASRSLFASFLLAMTLLVQRTLPLILSSTYQTSLLCLRNLTWSILLIRLMGSFVTLKELRFVVKGLSRLFSLSMGRCTYPFWTRGAWRPLLITTTPKGHFHIVLFARVVYELPHSLTLPPESSLLML